MDNLAHMSAFPITAVIVATLVAMPFGAALCCFRRSSVESIDASTGTRAAVSSTPLLGDTHTVIRTQRVDRLQKLDTAATNAAAKVSGAGPAYKSNRSHRGDEDPAPHVSMRMFCDCGGPGSVVRLEPCGHQALCLLCAQTAPSCPDCSTPIADSVPSFKG
jgi:hypothetical protein